MTKRDKLIERFLNKQGDFPFSDLKNLMSYLDYSEVKTGKTAGSRVAFKHGSGHIIRIHKPHPDNKLKRYQVNFLLETLTERGFFK